MMTIEECWKQVEATLPVYAEAMRQYQQARQCWDMMDVAEHKRVAEAARDAVLTAIRNLTVAVLGKTAGATAYEQVVLKTWLKTLGPGGGEDYAEV